MRLGFHYHIPAIERDGKVWMPGYLGLFVESLASRCEKLVCFSHTPTAAELTQMDYAIRADNVRLVNIGSHSSVPRRTASAFFNRDIYKRWQLELDVLLVRAPTPLLPILKYMWRKPMVLLVVGDLVEGLRNLPSLTFHQRIESIWAHWNSAYQLQVAKQNLTLVNSRVLYEKLRSSVPHLVETQTTTLRTEDFFYREDTCLTKPYRLLYTGRMTAGKGLELIVSAVASLVADGFDVVLDLVGMKSAGDSFLERLISHAQSLGVQNRVVYHGYKTIGKELLAYYQRADVFVMASEAEGFPRTIWEAMATSLPVVSTTVGSVPAFVGDAAVLIPPKDLPALTDALRCVFASQPLRQTLIRKGITLAANNTLDKRADELVEHIKTWLNTHASRRAEHAR
jgi:glycosyltransferase involved in cell wall biosynthesis